MNRIKVNLQQSIVVLLLPPVVEPRFADAHLATQVRDLLARADLLQRVDDLFLSVSLLLHRGWPFVEDHPSRFL